MERLTMEQINEGLKMNGGVAGKLPNMREVNPTRAINEELKKMEENRKMEEVREEVIIEVEMVEGNDGALVVVAADNNDSNNDEVKNIDDCVEIITEEVEWVKDSFDLVYGTAYEGGIRYTEPLEPLMTW